MASGDEVEPQPQPVGIKGFAAVDSAPNPSRLIEGMDGADRHDAVVALRAWATDQLRLGAGDRVVDVGCGTGTAARALAALVGESGRICGVDNSELIAWGRARYVNRLAPTAELWVVRPTTPHSGVKSCSDRKIGLRL